ncbi:hypothetical protein WEH80_06070 [Actinomycetes bacterium KLBMP 9759]
MSGGVSPMRATVSVFVKESAVWDVRPVSTRPGLVAMGVRGGYAADVDFYMERAALLQMRVALDEALLVLDAAEGPARSGRVA